jgi:hypothetical protein
MERWIRMRYRLAEPCLEKVARIQCHVRWKWNTVLHDLFLYLGPCSSWF